MAERDRAGREAREQFEARQRALQDLAFAREVLKLAPKIQRELLGEPPARSAGRPRKHPDESALVRQFDSRKAARVASLGRPMTDREVLSEWFREVVRANGVRRRLTGNEVSRAVRSLAQKLSKWRGRMSDSLPKS
jgi:hypothetical protein